MVRNLAHTKIGSQQMGGHLALLGGPLPLLNVSRELMPINVMSHYEPLVLAGATSLRVVPRQKMLRSSFLFKDFAFEGSVRVVVWL